MIGRSQSRSAYGEKKRKDLSKATRNRTLIIYKLLIEQLHFWENNGNMDTTITENSKTANFEMGAK